MTDRPALTRRTWPQRFLLLAGVLTSIGFFVAANFFSEARAVLAELPRIAVGPDVLAQSGEPGDPVNLLLVGVDSSEGLDEQDPVRQGRDTEDEARGVVRPDTILVARLDPATGTASVLSLPRDLIVEAPGGAITRINATQTVGGISSLIETIDLNFDIPINHFVVADFAGFSELVDIVGGVSVYFPYPTRDLGSGLRIDEAGCWALTGNEALAYVRSRNIEEEIDQDWVPLEATSPDLARIARQQEFMVLALEQVLSVGRSDISRISEFIDAGAQAVQLDEQLTPGDMIDLAEAFADYDTAELEISTMPVAGAFAEDGRYIGEELIVADADALLRRFQGLDDGVRPEAVTVEVRSSNDQHVEQLVERGFLASGPSTDEDGDDVSRSTVIFDPVDRDAALLLTRYLEGVPPQLVAQSGATLRLVVGNDFAGVRVFPRPVADIAPGLDLVIRTAQADQASADEEVVVQTQTTGPISSTTGVTSTTLATTTTSETSATILATESDTALPSSLASVTTDKPTDLATSENPPPTIVVRGRPPLESLCVPTGG